MAEAFPRSTFLGSDYHPGSIETAAGAPREAGVADRARSRSLPPPATPATATTW